MKQLTGGLLFGLAANVAFAGAMGDVAVANHFDGFYAGLGTGMLTLLTEDAYTSTRSTGRVSSGQPSWSDAAVLFDGHIGYGRMVAPTTYLGAKGSVYYTLLQQKYTPSYSVPLSASTLLNSSHTDTYSLKPIYSIDAVLGYEVMPNLMPFVEAGVSFANVKANYLTRRTVSDLAANTVSAYSNNMTSDTYRTGGNVGMGASYLVKSNWFLSAELLYHYLGQTNTSQTVVEPTTGTTVTFANQSTNQSVSLLASISYLFPSV